MRRKKYIAPIRKQHNPVAQLGFFRGNCPPITAVTLITSPLLTCENDSKKSRMKNLCNRQMSRRNNFLIYSYVK